MTKVNIQLEKANQNRNSINENTLLVEFPQQLKYNVN